ncbi:hypothetical protein Forpe1208_v012801 [Fusarium oxysporum f. sp. rapae]|uniref:Uncharacterized protein n=1 Tax=Fusarium oxysporum f. sp. rapae TaxID=485398 RepID=A0A8J5TRV2_FUSOX|nr:hypothetical protein Forpe1208_v012801 [Fusarium oxysporum f. sp. rapae]
MFLSRYNAPKSKKKPKKKFPKARIVDDDSDIETERNNNQRLPKERTTDKESNIIDKKISKQRKIDVVDRYWQTDDVRRQRYDLNRDPIIDVPPADMESNECYKLNNKPINTQTYTGLTLAPHEPLRYDSFIPTGETYEFLPCAPFSPDAIGILGFKRYRGNDTIMERYGDFMPGTSYFKPYKLLLYRGRLNAQPQSDDNHRFVYLAPSKPGEPQVGDCFIRLEEIHKRMKGESSDYEQDYTLAIEYATILKAIQRATTVEERQYAENRYSALLNDRGGLLRFRCWTVAGVPSAEDENRLSGKLFGSIRNQQQDDCIEVFRVWAEILRKSQGDKLAAKEFFGRYWDAVIPTDSTAIFGDGFKIIVGANYLQDRGFNEANAMSQDERRDMREIVFHGVQRVVDTPRLKFKPLLYLHNVVFEDELNINANDYAKGWFEVGWRYLEAHPGGLYTIAVNLPVRQFLYSAVDGKPFWQPGYGAPLEPLARGLHGRLNRCGQTQPTTTEVETHLVEGTKHRTRLPTQDKCVADRGYSANLALSDVYPEHYPNAADAKKRRVAEWLHRSAFSYGGLTKGYPNSSQVANNLVLGTPDTNTVMMRQANPEQGCTVFVETQINYPALVGSGEEWIGDDQHRYTWLSPELLYGYYNYAENTPHVFVIRHLFPLNRESCMLFQALLDKSLENKCWEWDCWGNDAVAIALIESTRVDDDQEEEPTEEKLKEMLAQDLAQRPE